MKKLIACLLLMSMVFTIVACNQENDSGHLIDNEKTASSVESSIQETDPDTGLWSEHYKEELTLEDLGYDELTEEKINDLYLLGKVWGFLKYYHPKIRSGHIDWDMELMGILEPYSKVESEEERDQLLLAWIKGLGVYEDEVSQMNPIDVDIALKPDFDWMDAFVESSLKEALENIIHTKRGVEQYYVDYSTDGGYISKNEKNYDDQEPSNVAIRMLTLFRYWNTYNYYSPYIDITDKPWDDVLKEMIPHFLLDENGDAFVGHLRRLTALTGDEHTYYTERYAEGNSVFGKYYLPLKARYFDDELVLIDSYDSSRSLEKMGLEAGDVLTHIDGKPVEEIYNEMDPFVPTSYEARNRLYLWDFYLFRTHHINMALTVKREDEIMDVKTYTSDFGEVYLTRHYNTQSKANRSAVFEDLGEGIVYLNLDNFSEETIDQYQNEILSSKAMIWDLRSYPDYSMVIKLLNLVLAEPLQGITLSEIYPPTPGTFVYNETITIGSNNSKPYEGHIIALVDGHSKSRPEYFAMYIKAMTNGTVIGRSTAGVDGNVSKMILPCHIGVSFTGLGIFYPDGTKTQRIGIIPDMEVDLTLDGLLEGQDEIYEKAVEYLRNTK